MAKDDKKPTTERIYTIPLRKNFLKSPKWKRSKKSITVIRDFIKKHMKTENVNINKDVNELIWARGSKKPPAKLKVIASKTEDKVKVGLFNISKQKPEVKEENQQEPKSEQKEVKENQEKPKKTAKNSKSKSE
ncbi:MAG: 50S ribosomal protein L31e [Candidatus Nanoarchaeia archaeon]|nr:50S ribosomal protein L31e [Candidatus Nanoarchaeia archaeon]